MTVPAHDSSPFHGRSAALSALREATSAQHDLLDTGLPLAHPDAVLADYLSHLQMLSRWLAPIQAWQAGFADGPQDESAPPPVDRLAVIDGDLAAAGQARNPVTGDAVQWPPQASPAYRWGVSYVVEGSQLGGAVLYKRLAGRLAPHPLAYLRGAAEGAGPRWRAFMAALNAGVQGEAAVAEACLGARDAFARILAMREN